MPIGCALHLLNKTRIREGLLQAGLSWDQLPASFPQPWYIEHATLTRVHLATGALITILGFLQFIGAIRERAPAVHRWTGRLFVVAGAVAAVSGVAMNFLFPAGGLLKYAGGYFFGVVVLVSAVAGWRSIRRGNVASHRKWMSRAFAIAIAAGLQRLMMSVALHGFGLRGDFVTGVCLWSAAVVCLGVNELLNRRYPLDPTRFARTSPASTSPRP